MTRTTPEQRADLARMLDAAMLDAGMSGPWREWGDMWIQLGTTRALIVAAVNALPDLLADLADAEAEVESLTAALRITGQRRILDLAAERDALREMVRSFGRTIDRWGKLIIEATGSEDITTPDGDGDWEVVEHRLSEVRAEQERLTVALRLAQARATDAETEARLLAAKVERVRELHRESRGSMSALYPNPICECGKDYPCPTIRALDGEADR